MRNAAVRSIRQDSRDKWPEDGIEPLADAVVKFIKDTPADQRTGPAIAQTVQLGNDLSQEMDDTKGQAIRKQLRELAVPRCRHPHAPRADGIRHASTSSCRRASRWK